VGRNVISLKVYNATEKYGTWYTGGRKLVFMMKLFKWNNVS